MKINKKYDLGLRYVGDGQRMVGGFNPDFIDIERKIIVEIMGDYYHLRKNRIKKDSEKFKMYRALGWRTIFIWASELKDLDKILPWFE